MTSSTSSSRVLPAIAAVLAPLALVLVTLWLWGRPDPADARGADLAGCEQTPHDGVVVVGNSKMWTDLDKRLIGQELGVRPVTTVGRRGSAAPLWYASLERCVFGPGYQPKLLLVYATAGSILRTTVDSELERTALEVHLDGDDPVIDRKVFGGSVTSPFWKRVRARKTALVAGLQHGVRDSVAGLLFAPPSDDGLLAAGRAFAEPALEAVLGADAGDVADRARAIPIAEAVTDGPDAPRELAAEDTLVPDLVALARAHGIPIVFANAPVSAAKTGAYDPVAPDLVREAVAWLNEAEVRWLDLTDVTLPDSAYGDGIHMNRSGRNQLSRALADRLVAADVLGDGPFTAAPLPRQPPRFARTGRPALPPWTRVPIVGRWDCGSWQARAPGLEAVSDSALLQQGFGAVSPLVLLEEGVPLRPHARNEELEQPCAGVSNHTGGFVGFTPTPGPPEAIAARTYRVAASEDLPVVDAQGRTGWWVYPGTTLRILLDEPWSGPEVEVQVDAHVPIPGRTPAALAVRGLGRAPMARRPGGVSGRLAGPTTGGPWRIDLAVPPDGPWLLVERVAVGTPDQPWVLLGEPELDRTVRVLDAPVVYAAAPPPLPPLGAVAPSSTERFWRFDTSASGVPGDREVFVGSGVPGASPVVLLEDGVPLRRIDAEAQAGDDLGLYDVGAKAVAVRPSDGLSPLENGRTYTAVLDPTRTCRKSRWLYPGDVARFTVGPNLLDRLATGATALDLTGAAFGGDEDPEVTVRVRVGGRVVFAGTRTLRIGAPRVTLPTEVRVGDGPVEVEVSTAPDAPFVLLTDLALVEPGPPLFGP